MSLMFCGTGVSRGIAIAPAFILSRDRLKVSPKSIDKTAITKEVRRFKNAINTARKQLNAIKNTIPNTAPTDISAFIETHLLMLDDTTLSERPINIIRKEACNAEWALKLQREELVSVFESMDDPYLATRIDDVNHVIDRILRALAGKKDIDDDFGHDWAGHIVIAEDLTPADTVIMQHQGVAGFITETGGPLSHAAILARSLGIPAAVGVHGISRFMQTGEPILLDGIDGLVIAEADKDTVSHFQKNQRELKRKRKELAKLIDTKAITKCGQSISLMTNIEIDDDYRAFKRNNADGVGLYRTEFLFMNRDTLPTEDEHFKAYRKVMRALKGAPLTIRTVDLGSDKESNPDVHCTATNPALGLRGIRRCLSEPRMLIPQLRAILRASAFGPTQIMFPMLCNISEVEQIIEIIDRIKRDLRKNKIKFDTKVKLGAMIEVPSAAITASSFASRLDFLSIGTNDLIQYTLAMDRVDDQVNYLYDPLNPAVLQLIKNTIDAGNKANISVSMCGEMAGDIRYTKLLLALGLREFSMPANSLLEVKSVLTQTDITKIRRKALAIINCYDKEKQTKLLNKLNE